MATSSTTHECPAPGCTEQCPFDRLACRSHWFSISPSTRARLLRAWARNRGETEYFLIRADCLYELGVPESEIAAQNGGVERVAT